MKGPALFPFSKLNSLVSLIKKKTPTTTAKNPPKHTKLREGEDVSDSTEKHADVLFFVAYGFVGNDCLLMKAKALSN